MEAIIASSTTSVPITNSKVPSYSSKLLQQITIAFVHSKVPENIERRTGNTPPSELFIEVSHRGTTESGRSKFQRPNFDPPTKGPDLNGDLNGGGDRCLASSTYGGCTSSRAADV